MGNEGDIADAQCNLTEMTYDPDSGSLIAEYIDNRWRGQAGYDKVGEEGTDKMSFLWL